MFSFLVKKTNKELEAICMRIDSNMANNYKDAAQEALKELEMKLESMELKPEVKSNYESRWSSYKERMKQFTHKDQKPYWT